MATTYQGSMQTSITRERSLRVWVGTENDLHRLLQHVMSALNDQRQAALQTANDTKARLLDEGLDEAFAEAKAGRLRARARQDFTERATATDARTKVQRTGLLSEVVAATSSKDMSDLSLTFPQSVISQPRCVWLFFSRGNGLHVRVDADEQVWANAMLAETIREAQRNTPWWAAVFAPLGRALLSMVLQVSLFLFTFSVERGLRLSIGLKFFIAAGLAVPITFILTYRSVLNRILPRFEVLPVGTRATGTIRALALGGLILTALVSALVPFLIR